MFNYICLIMRKVLLVIACLLLLHGNVSAQNKGFEKAIEVNGSVGLDNYTKYTFGANFIGGYRFNDSFYIGAGVGYTYLEGLYYSSYEYVGKYYSKEYDSYDVRSNLQVFVRTKLNLSSTKVSPFVMIDLGGTFGLSSNEIKMANGFMYEPAIGVDFKINETQTVYAMLGYKGQQYQYNYFNLTYGNTSDEMLKENSGSFCFHVGFKF